MRPESSTVRQRTLALDYCGTRRCMVSRGSGAGSLVGCPHPGTRFPLHRDSDTNDYDFLAAPPVHGQSDRR